MNEPCKTPWLANYGEVRYHLDYPDISMFDKVCEIAEQYPEHTAYEFMGKKTSYREMVRQIKLTGAAFRAQGVAPGDKVTLCLPNTPQTVCCFYALNYIGAIANMIHPLSSEGEIIFYLQDSGSVAAVTLDQFYPKFAAIQDETHLPRLIIGSIADALSPLKRAGYKLTEGKKIKPIPAEDKTVVTWADFLAAGAAYTGPTAHPGYGKDAAVILYSGGTSGKTKGILLSNLNFNALGMQTIAMDNHFAVGDKVLSVMPMFHGFGLGVSIHTFLSHGGSCILVPRFNAATYAKLLAKNKPNYIAGVPTLYEALLRNPDIDDLDLSCLKGVFSGGDSLSIELKKKFDRFLAEHGCKVQIREGYGTTECVTASCLTPYHQSREGSIGLPYPDTYYKICKSGGNEEVPYGEEGEICLSGPTVMLEYVNQPEETADTLRRHEDGLIWLHTGDLGVMDEDGFVYFRQRIKRMIVSSGYSIYPSQLENIIDAHPKVLMSCVIGVPDTLKVQKVKGFVMLRPDFEPTQEVHDELMAYCRRNIAKYAMPYELEFRAELPKTLVGKVAYKVLEDEEEARRLAAVSALTDAYGPTEGEAVAVIPKSI
ncbi:MAG: AMP-binding protein [Bacillota bacterium]|nr:AMP-binding protein [Bacillota bacterium]